MTTAKAVEVLRAHGVSVLGVAGDGVLVLDEYSGPSGEPITFTVWVPATGEALRDFLNY